MARPTIRGVERYYFEQFRKHYDLPPGVVEYSDKPDVRLNGAQIIGVEIARLYITDGGDYTSEQVQIARRDRVLEQAQLLHQQGGGKKIELTVDFDPAQPIVNIDDSALRLANLAHEIQLQPTTLTGSLIGNAEGLRLVHHSGEEYPNAKWRAQKVYNTRPLDSARIKSLVAEKVEKSGGYDQCDEYWLLLIVDYFDPAQDQDLVLPSEFRLEQDTFRRVLIYKPQFGQVVQVPQ
jgi:hypothetical protein